MPVSMTRTPTTWEDKATALLGTPKQACFTMIADASAAAFGIYAGPLGHKVASSIAVFTGIAAAGGSLEGTRRAWAHISIEAFQKDLLLSVPVIILSSQCHEPLQIITLAGGIFTAARAFTGTAVQAQEEGQSESSTSLVKKLVGRSVQYGTGALVGTAVAASITGTTNFAVTMLASIVAAKAARATIRAVGSRLFA